MGFKYQQVGSVLSIFDRRVAQYHSMQDLSKSKQIKNSQNLGVRREFTVNHLTFIYDAEIPED